MTSVATAHECPPLLDDLLERVGPRFTRPEPRQRAQLFVRGILSGPARKNSWTLAGFAGEADPTGMQRLLTSARWDVDGVRDDLRAWVLDRLGDPEYGVLVPIELGFPKKGTGSVGVHRHFNDAARRAENVQVGVFLVYAAPGGWAVVDRELYLPPSWVADPQRCERLGVPDDVGFLTKPELARRMIARVLASGAPAPWVTAGDAFGADPALRSWLDAHDVRYGVAGGGPHPGPPGVWGRSPEAARSPEALAGHEGPPEWERLEGAPPAPAGGRVGREQGRGTGGPALHGAGP